MISTKGERRKGQRPRAFLRVRVQRFSVKATIVPFDTPAAKKNETSNSSCSLDYCRLRLGHLFSIFLADTFVYISAPLNFLNQTTFP